MHPAVTTNIDKPQSGSQRNNTITIIIAHQCVYSTYIMQMCMCDEGDVNEVGQDACVKYNYIQESIKMVDLLHYYMYMSCSESLCVSNVLKFRTSLARGILGWMSNVTELPFVSAQSTVHLKLTFYAHHTGTGMGVLCATKGCAMGTDTVVASAIFSEQSRSKMVVFVQLDDSECQQVLEQRTKPIIDHFIRNAKDVGYIAQPLIQDTYTIEYGS